MANQSHHASADPDSAEFVYDEFAYLDQNCSEYDLVPPDGVDVARIEHRLGDDRTVSALRWGDGPIDVVLVHGGAQNAHTWDTVALALRPRGVLAIDLPGHGHSSWRDDGDYHPRTNAEALAAIIGANTTEPVTVVGMSLGGLSVNALAAAHPELVRRLIVIDVTPGVDRDKAADVHAFIAGPQEFEDFASIFDRTVAFNPTRTEESLRRGILHNAHRSDDGTWRWNYDRGLTAAAGSDDLAALDRGSVDGSSGRDLWQDVAAVRVDYTLVRASLSPVVDDADEAELLRLQPRAEVLTMEGAGHSVQGDRPIELAAIISERLG